MIKLNISGLEEVQEKLAQIDMDKLCFDVASTLKAEIRNRVHVEGLASDGSKIGTYTKAYMVTRTGAYQNSETYKKGKNKGQLKNPGFYTKGKKAVFDIESRKAVNVKESKRKNFNRGSDTDVILSLTRQMENDLNATEPIKVDGGYGIGYRNEHNYDKAIWNEQRYKKPIWNLTKEEEQLAEEVVNTYIENLK